MRAFNQVQGEKKKQFSCLTQMTFAWQYFKINVLKETGAAFGYDICSAVGIWQTSVQIKDVKDMVFISVL